MSEKIPHGQGFEDEPFADGWRSSGDAAEDAAERTLKREAERGGGARDQAMQSVFDESHGVVRSDKAAVIDRDVSCPGCGYNLRGSLAGHLCPECGHGFTGGYAEWLDRTLAQSTEGQSWAVVLVAVLAGGIWAILGAVLAGAGTLGVVVFGPVAEEIMKVALVLTVIETRPYLLRSAVQIWTATLASALMFAVIENLIYQHLYIEDPTPALLTWRWTVCTALHIGCTAIATLGVLRVWRNTIQKRRPAQLSRALPLLVTAMVVHGGYNALALTGFDF